MLVSSKKPGNLLFSELILAGFNLKLQSSPRVPNEAGDFNCMGPCQRKRLPASEFSKKQALKVDLWVYGSQNSKILLRLCRSHRISQVVGCFYCPDSFKERMGKQCASLAPWKNHSALILVLKSHGGTKRTCSLVKYDRFGNHVFVSFMCWNFLGSPWHFLNTIAFGWLNWHRWCSGICRMP